MLFSPSPLPGPPTWVVVCLFVVVCLLVALVVGAVCCRWLLVVAPGSWFLVVGWFLDCLWFLVPFTLILPPPVMYRFDRGCRMFLQSSVRICVAWFRRVVSSSKQFHSHCYRNCCCLGYCDSQPATIYCSYHLKQPPMRNIGFAIHFIPAL